MRIHTYPFKKRKIRKNMDRWVKLSRDESYVAYLDTTPLGGKSEGFVLTDRRLVQFEKDTVLHTSPLKDINQVTIDVDLDRYHSWILTLSVGSETISIEFDEWRPLAEFNAQTEELLGRSFGIRAAGLKLGRRALQKAGSAPLARAALEKAVSLKAGEQVIAYRTQRYAAGTLEYALTNLRVVEFGFSGLGWELALDDIESFDFGFMGNLKLWSKSGKKRTIPVEDYYMYDAMLSLIQDIRGSRLEATPSRRAKRQTTYRPVRYPLELEIVSRGWLEGFKYKVTDASGRTVFQVECRESETMHVAEGDALASIIRMQKPEKHYTFETPDGRKTGEIKCAGRELAGPVKYILDAQGNKVGTVRKKPGLRSLATRDFQLELNEQPVLELGCQLQSPFHTCFEVNKLRDVSPVEERLLLNCVFALRLVEPGIMKDPVMSKVSKVRSMGKDLISDL